MKEYYSNIIYTAVSIVVIASCSPAYVSNSANFGTPKQVGDVSITVATGKHFVEPQVSISPINGLGLFASAAITNMEWSDDENGDEDFDQYRHQKFYEFGGGYYHFNSDNILYANVYAGFGQGKIDAIETSLFGIDTSSISSRYNRYFFQPGIGLNTGPFELVFNLRFSYLDMIFENKIYSDMFLEPSIYMCVGSENLKFCLQTGLVFPYHDKQIVYEYSPFIFAFGAKLSFNIFNKKSKQ